MDIEELDLDVKTYNRLKRDGINTTGELLCEMYKGGENIVVSTPDAKRCEAALKNAGIIRFMRGDFAEVSDIDPKPLTWDELHGYIGKLVVHDESTESRRWLVVCWLYDVKDQDCGNAIFISRGTSFGHARRTTVNGELSRADNPNLQNEGRFFALRQGTPLETLGLSTRTYNAAVRFGISSVEELAERISEFCTHAPNCGNEAEKALNKGEKTVAENEIISENYTKAVALHRKICANAQSAQESLFEVCRGLKEMRDGKLYKELGYQNFEEYTENEVGISRFMAYKYTAIADMENVESIQQIGVTKLALLAKLDEPERAEITQNTDLESVSVRELKTKIADLKKANERLMGKVDEAEKRAESSRKSEENACGKLSILRTDSEMQKARISQLEAEKSALEEQVEELENRPVEVAVQESHEVENMRLAMEKLNEDIAKQDAQMRQEYEDRIRSLKERHEAELKAAQVQEIPDTKAVFKAYLSNAIDASKRLTEFLKQHPEPDFSARVKELFTRILQEV